MPCLHRRIKQKAGHTEAEGHTAPEEIGLSPLGEAATWASPSARRRLRPATTAPAALVPTPRPKSCAFEKSDLLCS